MLLGNGYEAFQPCHLTMEQLALKKIQKFCPIVGPRSLSNAQRLNS